MSLRFWLLASLLLLPVIAAIVGVPISMKNPAMKPDMARLFFGALTISGAGQALVFGRKLPALIIFLCGTVLLIVIH